MTFLARATKEIKDVGLITLYFAIWFGLLMLLKRLILAEYQIEFRGIWSALIGALVAAKVVLVMENVPLGIRHYPAAFDVAVRTLIYTLGVLIVLLIEKGFEGRHEYGGFAQSVRTVFQHRDIHHVWANTIGVGMSLLGFTVISVIRQGLGGRELFRLFFATPLAELETKKPKS